MDDFYLLIDIEVFISLLPQAPGDSCDSVRFIDGELYDWCKSLIVAYQRDICTMQGGDYRDIAALRQQDFFGDIGYRRMGDCVMDVEQVQVFVLDHIHEFARQCRIIRWIFEEWVFVSIHFVIEHIFLECREAGGSFIGNEMNFMPSFGKAEPQLGRYHPATAIRRITYNSNFHNQTPVTPSYQSRSNKSFSVRDFPPELILMKYAPGG